MAAQSPSFKPTARQQLLMDAVAKALDDGAFYNSDVDEHVAKTLGVTLEQRARNSRGVEGGDFGYDVYNATRAVQAQRSNAKSREFAKALNLKPGDVLGTLVFNDGKVTTGVKVNGLSDSGLVVTVTGKRGAATLNGEVGIDRLAAAMDSAKERGKRKDGYAEFVAGRGAVQPSLPAPATHADPGQAPEVATPAVVAQSVQKAARNEDTKPSEMRKWLVGKIDEAIAVAPEAAVDFLSFDVPGDGAFKVQNSQARLQEFRKKVMASPGFKDGGQKQNTKPPEQVDSAINGSGSTVEALRNFLADGDVQGAIEFAKLKGVEFTPVPPQMKMSADGKGKVKHMPASVKSSVPSVAEGLTQVEAEQINQYLTAERQVAEAVAQPITRADVTAAQQQAAAIITERIDAMTAGEVNTIARRFLPTMGVRPTVSKERNKAAVVDFTKVNPMAAADEFGATLPADVRRALQADMEGRVTGQEGLMFSRGTTAGMPENKAPGPQGDAQQGASTGNAVTSKWFTEDNRLSNLSQTGASWQRIRENNPVLRGKSVDDTITVYRATIGDSIRPDDYVAVDKSTLRTELKNVRERDGDAAKIVSMQVQVRDLLMGNDATEFVFFPEQKTEALGTDENTGLPLNADGSVTIYHHTSAAAATAIRRTGTLKSQAEPDVYVTTYRETDTGYGDTAVAIRIDPARLQIDDEFPNGRKDFRLNVGRPGGSIRVELENEQSAPASQGGLAFSFAGARAATADKHALVTAQDRLSAGEDAETVRQETGWFQGKDGKWRFEISDAGAQLAQQVYFAERGKWYPSRFLADARDHGSDTGGTGTLGDVLEHPALFAAYPALRDMPVTAKIRKDQESGAFDGRSITATAENEGRLLSVLLHEIQHGIQNIEGFATGGSIESARAMQADAQSNAFNQAQGAWYESRKRWPSAYKALMDQRMLDGRLYDKYDIKTMDEDGNQRKSIVLAFELRKKISEADKALRS